jgi:DNA-binding MarR family transcriptional regulator
VPRRSPSTITEAEYQARAQLRYHIRRFLRFSEEAARKASVEPQQHELLLAIKGASAEAPTVGELAENLQIRHHSAVELIDRCERNGLIRRTSARDDRRRVLVELTPTGKQVLRKLAVNHREGWKRYGPPMAEALAGLLAALGSDAFHPAEPANRRGARQ